MEETFDAILSSILDSIEKNPEGADQILADKLAKEGISAEGCQLLKDTLSMVDTIEEKKQSLREAKAAGSTREVWTQEQLNGIVSKQPLSEDDQNAIVSEIEKKYNESLKETIEKGE